MLYASLHVAAQSATDTVRQRMEALGSPECPGNHITMLPLVQEKYDTLFNNIRSAERYIHIEYFWIANDSVGNAFTALLAERAREGVEVRMIIDGYANHKSKSPWRASHIDSLNALGIRTVMFSPLRFPWVNHLCHRNHRKMVVIDGNHVFAGGMNIADYYLTGTELSGPWRDMHFRVSGPAVEEYERVFERIWEKETGEQLCPENYRGDGTPCGVTPVSVVNREPHRLSRLMREAYTVCIDAARTEVRILNPYLTNVRMVHKAMLRARKKGVRVVVMVSASNDVHTTPDLVAVETKKLMKRGCEVYFYEGGFHHGKVMTVDGELCSVGSANFDGRSLMFDYEINAFMFSRESTGELNSIFDCDLLDSQLLTPEEFKRRFSLKHRMTGRVLGVVKSLF